MAARIPMQACSATSNGNLYGTTVYGGIGSSGGLGGNGTVYKLDPEGKLTPLYALTGGLDGGNPYGGVYFDIGDTDTAGTLQFGPAHGEFVYGRDGTVTFTEPLPRAELPEQA